MSSPKLQVDIPILKGSFLNNGKGNVWICSTVNQQSSNAVFKCTFQLPRVKFFFWSGFILYRGKPYLPWHVFLNIRNPASSAVTLKTLLLSPQPTVRLDRTKRRSLPELVCAEVSKLGKSWSCFPTVLTTNHFYPNRWLTGWICSMILWSWFM